MALVDPCLYLQADAHPARSFRQLITAMLAEGILGSTSFAVTQRGAGANFSVDVAAGMGVVQGDSATQQGRYLVVNDATVNDATTVITSAPSAGNERYDRVILEVKDNAEDAGGINAPRFRVVAGTPAAVGTAVAPALPNTAITLAIVGPILNSTATITNSLIVDGRVVSRLSNEVVNSTNLANLAVTTAKIADSAVTSAKIADDTIALADINTGARSVFNVPNTLVQRFSDGRFEGATPLGNNDVATAGYVLGLLSGGWTTVSLVNSWANVSGSTTLRHKKIGDIVYLVGSVDGAAAGASTIGTLPVGSRPVATVRQALPDSAGGVVSVASSGNITGSPGDIIDVNTFFPTV